MAVKLIPSPRTIVGSSFGIKIWRMEELEWVKKEQHRILMVEGP